MSVPNLTSLIIFARVVEANSFSEAARRLKIPLSTVSRRIAELEDDLGVRLLERSTRSLRLTDVGSRVLQFAQRGAELSEAVNEIASDVSSKVSGMLRLAAPPSISDSLLAPLVNSFQKVYPDVRVQIMITERIVDHVEEGVDLLFRVGALRDSSLVARKILTYRHRLLASPAYLKTHKRPTTPEDLLGHRLIAFSRWQPENRWHLVHANGKEATKLRFEPYLSINDYAGIVPALLAGVGIGELPPLVRPELVRQGRLVEVMQNWRLRTFDLWLLHIGNRHLPRAVYLFKEFAARNTPKMFPKLPA
ncbi:MAG TPA: LysR family transcriptional regulator [Candidatus Baltobacteraceae bacterium]|jgi:DNA-binding transcriptional LysR family regulator|nr:LysR family transcriptional regulator [Candidatus Baltobacteraceae bacterium]